MSFKNKKISIKTRILFYFILLVVISVAVTGIVSVTEQVKALDKDVKNNVISMAKLAASQIEADSLAKINGSTTEDSQQYKQIKNVLVNVIEASNGQPLSEISKHLNEDRKKAVENLAVVYAYTMYVDGDAVKFGVDAYPAYDRQNHSAVGSDNNSNIAAFAKKVMKDSNTLATDSYKDEYGHWKTAIAPVLNASGAVVGLVAVDASVNFIKNEENKLAATIAMYSLILLVIAILISIMLSINITTPICQLSDGAKKIASGDLDYKLDIATGDEIGDLADEFNQMTTDLKKYIKDLQQTIEQKQKIESDLKVAHNIQISMLPRIFPAFPDRKELGIYATMEPAKEVGGDFYDFFFIDSKRLFFVIGDVSGKGVPASLFMVITKTLLKNQALQGLSPDQILYTVNNQLCLDNDEGMFVTVFCAILDLESGVVEYSNAGHNPPLVYRQGGSYEYMQSKKSFVLGGMENFKYQSNTLTLDLNDAIYLYTDGVTEAMNNQDQLFSEERLKATLFELKQQNEEEILHGVKAAIGDFVKETPQSDDITMLIVKLKQKMNS